MFQVYIKIWSPSQYAPGDTLEKHKQKQLKCHCIIILHESKT